jgi:hypothetical protein
VFTVNVVRYQHVNKNSGSMVKHIISLLIFLVLLTSLSGCSSSKKSTSDLRGLMLLENSQLGRNKSYYSKRGSKKLVKKHAKFHKKIKKKSFGKQRRAQGAGIVNYPYI